MRTLLTILTLAFTMGIPQPAAAQSSDDGGRITGEVVDEENEQPLSGATVTLRNPADSSLVTGTTTDSTGAFALDNVPYGAYTLRVSFVGFATTRFTDVRLTRTQPTRDLETITLSAQTAQLDEVTVSAERPAMDVQTDRTVYNTSQQVVTAGGSARMVLEDLPSIQVDIDGSISYRGNEGVRIHINGEPTSLSGQALASFLQSLPAESVARVEVIPNPSARYAPEGAAGIINIVLKKNRSAGWSGGITAGGGTNDSYSASANVGYLNGPWRVFTNYGFRTGSEEEGGSRFRRNFTQDPTVLLDQSETEGEDDRSHTLNTQVEYSPTDATSFSMETVFSTDAETQTGRTNYLRETVGGSLLDRFARITDSDEDEQSIDTRLSFNHDFAPDDHNLAIELQYESEWQDENGSYVERALSPSAELESVRDREREMQNEREQEASLEIDYVQPFGDVMLEAGYQGELETERSDQLFEVLNQATDAFRTEDESIFDYDENTHAVYALLTRPLGNFEVKAGARAEQAVTTFTLPTRNESYDNNYFSIFPSAFLTYKPNERYQARLSYSKRVRRPSAWQLNPIDDNEDPTFRRIGNPQLDPEYVHSFELSLTRKWTPATLSVTPFYRRTTNEIERQETLSADGVTTLTYANFASSFSYGLELVTSLQMDEWVRGNVSINANRIVTDGSNLTTDLSNDAMEYSGRANLTFSIGPGLNLQLSQWYRAPMDIAGGEIGAMMSSEVGLQKSLFDGRGSISLRANDVFDAMNFNIERQTSAFYTESTRDWSQRQIMVTFSYSFGQDSNQRGGGRRGR
jgi:outer membrane receptor protein involved in Fe transport